MIRFFILAAYFEMSLFLFLSGKLDHYINLHYSYLAYLSSLLSLLLALVQLFAWMRGVDRLHSQQKKSLLSLVSGSLFLLPLLVAWGFPTVSLDAHTVAAKGYHFPLAATNDEAIQAQEGTQVQYLKPDTSLYFSPASYQKEMRAVADRYLAEQTITVTSTNYMEVMEAIYDYPAEFAGKHLEMVGFVYRDPDFPDQQFLFRFGIIHCIADSGVYGLLSRGNQEPVADNTWVTARGHLVLHYHPSLGQHLPLLELEELTPTPPPANPYVYRVF